MTTRIYIGGLPADVRESELDDIFGYYGRIRTIDIKGGRDGERTAFAFVDYNDDRNASEACYKEHGRTFAGNRLRVEPSHGPRNRTGGRYDEHYGGGRDRGGGGGYRDRDERRYDDRRGGLGPSPYGPSRKTDYQCLVSGLANDMSWQDLKDHFRSFKLEVTHADVDRRGDGTVSFASESDMDYALKHCDNTVMKNMRGECTIYVDPASSGGASRRSMSPAGGRSRSRSRTPY